MAFRKSENEREALSLSVENCLNQATVTCWQEDQQHHALDSIAEEVPIAMVYGGTSHAVMMASPADLEDFALGFSLSEGIVQKSEEVYGIDLVAIHSQDLRAGIEVHMAITTRRLMQLKERRRNLVGRTGCGLCGAQSLQQAIRPIKKVPPLPLVPPKAVENALCQLTNMQPLQNLTGAFHGAAWCDIEGNIQLLREDIGRHNALDKLLGAMTKTDTDLTAGFALVSSRASYEMVQKASSCGISTLVALSAPTGLALELTKQAGMNLIGFARPGRQVIYNKSTDNEE